MDSSDAIQFVILIVLLLLSAFFSSAETALTTVSKIRMRSLAEDGNKRAKVVLDVTENHSRKMLSAILIGNNIVNISASSLAATLAYSFGGYMVSIATAALTVAILVFGEITPKSIATLHSDKLSLSYIRVIRPFMTIMTPFIFIINLFSRGILFLFRIDPNAKNNAMTEDELRTIVDVSHEDGIIESEEKEMIYNVFDLGDARAKDVMVPRVHVTFADVNSTYKELIDIFKEDKFTRLPVYEDTTDNVIGTINMKDLLLFDNKEHFCVRDILREAYFTYEYKNISELLVEMRDASFNIAIVLDEYGETAGLITLEDILEEIVGEIHDEYDENEEEFVKQLNEYEYIIEGSMSLDDVNDRLDLELESEDYDSLGGFIIEHLDRLPEVGDEVTSEHGIRLVVETLDKNRVESVHVYLPEKTESDDEESDDENMESESGVSTEA
ncbi:HlyC/CorC family transporter [Clostridium sp. AF19-22AC]|uniref:HlyC/CorC family transporter n=1 Tax=Clostridia TaxID=186801 RepID=UPI000E4CC28C|nr:MULTISPECIES: hemolysin family protein [Clostridia]RHR29818.1 HlyC/CorC family transporter [Clostridium sp. AF19-22AC]